MTKGDNSPVAEKEVVAVFFGVFIGLIFLTAVKALRQTWGIWHRTKNAWNRYVWMIWIQLIANLVFAITTYLYIVGILAGNLMYYMWAMVQWIIITQLLLQIIANRISLIMMDQRKAVQLRWALFGIVAVVNVSVFCIWVPALMEVNRTWIDLNHVWERIEKSIFLLLDLALNCYFLYLVRSKLITQGLTKYWALFNFNAAAVVISTSMDVLLLGLQNLPNAYDYIQFLPVAYIVKLNIELTMAELISKIVRSAQKTNIHDYDTNLTSHSGIQADTYDLESDGYPGKTDTIGTSSEKQCKSEVSMA